MKKITLKLLLVFTFLFSTLANAQCLTAIEGLYPGATATATACDGITSTLITTLGYASEYSNVEVTAGETYTFNSSLSTDYITISNDDGITASAFGTTPLTWVADVTGVVRFYTHVDDLCGGNQNFRTRSFVCGIPPCTQPIVTFSKTFDCGSSSFEVTADITDIGSANTITVTDDQGSSAQTIALASSVTFGPYPFGTLVVLTVTNDDTPICNVVSDTQVIYACPPANDECDGAIALNVNPDSSCTDIVSASITAATASAVDAFACGGTPDDDVWFSFVATGTLQTISLNNVVGSTTDLFHSLWTGDCGSLTLVPNSCSDNNASLPTGLTIGETYYLRVYTWTDTAENVTFDVCIGTPPPPPANDECDGAIALNCGDVLTNQSTESATGGTGTSCVGTIGNDIWYSFSGDGQVITLTATATGIESPQVEVYASTDGTCAGFAPGTCIAAAGTGETVVSVPFVSVNGTSYYIHIGSWINGDPATVFDLAITCEAAPTPPANDDCDGAESLTVNPDASCAIVTSGTVSGATASAVDASACGGSPDDDVWYSFVATGTIQAISLTNIVGANTDLFHSLWTGDCGTLTLVPGSCSDADASVPSGLTEGQTYYVRVYTTTTSALQNTTFDICVGTPPPPPANDDCTGAIEITAGGTFATSPVIGSNVSSTSTAGLPTFSCQPNRANDVWYSVVVPDSGTLTVETATTPGTVMTDTVITVYRGSCGSLTEVPGGCDDDSGTDNFSKVSMTGLTAGETLYIGVWKWFGSSLDGDFQLSAYDASLSNDTFETSGFKAYPNPVRNMLNLSYNKNISKVAVYNLLGQEVLAKSMNGNLSQIDMSHLANGTYLVKVTADNQVKTIKVIKE